MEKRLKAVIKLDRESIITHLQIIHTWATFAREHDLQFFTPKHLEDIAQWSDDAIALIKEQPQIVRCKDCKKRYTEFCPDIDLPIQANDWFCADRERK